MKKVPTNSSRRKFMKLTGSTIAASSVGFNIMANTRPLQNFSAETLKVGLIGCGGRGTGAANQALNADPNVVLTAMGDVFPDRLEASYDGLMQETPDKVKVNKENKFIGFGAYQKVIDSGVDVVILATPPAFRPAHLEACIAAGKHVFFEKPVAVDAQGIRRVIATAKKAKEKNLGFMSGFCWRYDHRKREIYDRILNGDIGELNMVYNTYNTGALWWKEVKPSWGKFKGELRNWLYYNWLSGDHITEQAVHSLDMMSWAMGDKMPIKAVGTGGRQSRTASKYGNVYDHFAIVYEYENGAKGFHFSRQQKGCARAYHMEAAGTKGQAMVNVGTRHEIMGTANKNWRWESEHKKSEVKNMYQTEHNELFASIREGKPINDGIRSANSTMLAIWGRMVAYTGEALTWEEALNSEAVLAPKIDEYNWDLDWEMEEVAKPGLTKFV